MFCRDAYSAIFYSSQTGANRTIRIRLPSTKRRFWQSILYTFSGKYCKFLTLFLHQEYENDAEATITGLTITEEDKLETGLMVITIQKHLHPMISLALQLTQLDMYNKVLVERQQRKEYVKH